MERFTLDLGHIFFIQTRSMGPIMIFNRQFMRAGTLDGSLMALCGVTYTDFSDPPDTESGEFQLLESPCWPITCS